MKAAADAKGGDMSPFIQKYFKSVAMADVGRSAEHARELGYLRPTDRVVMNRFELLEVAKAEVRALAAGYRPPLRQTAIPDYLADVEVFHGADCCCGGWFCFRRRL